MGLHTGIHHRQFCIVGTTEEDIADHRRRFRFRRASPVDDPRSLSERKFPLDLLNQSTSSPSRSAQSPSPLEAPHSRTAHSAVLLHQPLPRLPSAKCLVSSELSCTYTTSPSPSPVAVAGASPSASNASNVFHRPPRCSSRGLTLRACRSPRPKAPTVRPCSTGQRCRSRQWG